MATSGVIAGAGADWVSLFRAETAGKVQGAGAGQWGLPATQGGSNSGSAWQGGGWPASSVRLLSNRWQTDSGVPGNN